MVIEIKYNNSTSERDPSIYLGIDASIIPDKYFSGIEKIRKDNKAEHGIIIASSYEINDIEFYVNEKEVQLMTPYMNGYVNPEDLTKVKEWKIIDYSI